MGRKVKVRITSSGKHYVMGMLTFEIVVVAMTTTTGEVLRDSVLEPTPKTVSMTTPIVMETISKQINQWGQRSLEGVLLAVVVLVIGWLLTRHSAAFLTLFLATPT